MYDRAAAKSWCLPAIILPSTLVPRVVRTSGAVVYKDEGTCIVRLRSDASAAFLTAPMPPGAFVQTHSAKGKRSELAPGTRIQWVERPQGATADQYLTHAKTIARDCGARVCYRARGNTCLGIAGCKEGSKPGLQVGIQPPRWALTGTPEFWAETDASDWLKGMAFTDIVAVARRGKNAWTCRAWPPDDVSTACGTFFSSGIVIAPAAAQAVKKVRAVSSAPAKWGAVAVTVPRAKADGTTN